MRLIGHTHHDEYDKVRLKSVLVNEKRSNGSQYHIYTDAEIWHMIYDTNKTKKSNSLTSTVISKCTFNLAK